MGPRDLIGGWFIAPRRRERRIDDHHLAVLRDPAAYGLTREDIDRIGARNRVAILTAVLQKGWARIRVPPTRGAAIHIEVWTFDPRRARRIETWLRHQGRCFPRDVVYLGVVATGRSELIAIERFRATLRDL